MPTAKKRPAREMKIAELVRISGVSRSTIHFYRNAGLLPAPTRRGPKLHIYGAEHVKRLAWVGALRREGIPLDAIRRRCREVAPSKPPRARTAKPLLEADGARERILESAAHEFVARGFADVHMEDIARVAGISKAKIYEHFSSKTALFVDCLDHLRYAVFGREARAALFGAEVAHDDESRLRACAVLVRFAPYRMMTNLLTEAAYGRDAELAGRAREALHRMVTNAEPHLARGVAEGHCRPIDTELLAYMTWGALLALGDRLALDDRYSLADALDAYLDFVRFGTAPLARSPGATDRR